MKHTKTVRAFTMAVDEEARTVEQIVSVFENVDLGKDRVKTGAFVGSLERWNASGDPIPAIWSHQWDDPFAHIGKCIDSKELAAGDPMLPEEIADLGGLWVKYQVDPAPFADQVFTLLKERRVREASFAYDVIVEKKNNDGTTDLVELDLIEVGPTLKGMNPLTQLLAAKSWRAELVAELVKAGATEHQAAAAVDAAGTKAYPPHTFIPKDDDSDRCSICDLTRNTVGHMNLLAGAADGEKANVVLTGSVEELLGSYFRAALDYAAGENIGNGGFYALHPEGTYPDESRAVYCVEGWDDPWNEGALFEFRFAADDDGELTVESITEVELEASLRPKSVDLQAAALKSARRGGSTSRPEGRGTVRGAGKAGKSEGKSQPVTGEELEDRSDEDRVTGNTGEAARALLELDAFELADT
jgi:HK97 family phage prohead protease